MRLKFAACQIARDKTQLPMMECKKLFELESDEESDQFLASLVGKDDFARWTRPPRDASFIRDQWRHRNGQDLRVRARCQQ